MGIENYYYETGVEVNLFDTMVRNCILFERPIEKIVDVRCADGRTLREEVKRFYLTNMSIMERVKVESEPLAAEANKIYASIKEKVGEVITAREARGLFPVFMMGAGSVVPPNLKVLCDGTFYNSYKCPKSNFIRHQELLGLHIVGSACSLCCAEERDRREDEAAKKREEAKAKREEEARLAKEGASKRRQKKNADV